MNLSQRLRQLAASTGLDGFAHELRAIADEMEAQPADVTDERQAFEKWLGIRPCGAAHDLAWSAWKARAILALRPVQVPMTNDVVRDAERYRWLADCNNYEAGIALIMDPKLTAHALGEKIDAAMKNVA